jgi:hypothetical protein
MAFIAVSTFVLNNKIGVIKNHVKAHRFQTDDIDLGEFEYPTGSGVLYDVHGNSSHEVIAVYFYSTGLPVSSFTSARIGWGHSGDAYFVTGLTVTPNTGDTPFTYSGDLYY